MGPGRLERVRVDARPQRRQLGGRALRLHVLDRGGERRTLAAVERGIIAFTVDLGNDYDLVLDLALGLAGELFWPGLGEDVPFPGI